MHVYFLGIGGAGIGPLAEIAYQAGLEVSGSDMQNTSYVDYLRAHGISDISVGDSVDLITENHAKKTIDWLVYSSAVSREEAGKRQLETARSLGIKTTLRDEFISEFIASHHLKMIAVAGTHGKTTTTAMLIWLFKNLNKPVSYLLPAKISFGEMGVFNKDSEYFIYEADEFDRNFLAYEPTLSLISGVSWDHHEIYPTREEYIAAFNDFISQSGQVVIWQSDRDYLNAEGDNLKVEDDNQPKLEAISLKGLYNRRDGWLAVSGLAGLLNVPEDELLSKLNDFPGLARRMEEISPGLYSDYAHTPEKIRGAISAASEVADEHGQELIVLYEPLTNRRQIHMLNDYKDCFKGAKHVYWLPSYLAREDPNDRIITPEELITKLDDPSIAEPTERDDHLLNVIRQHLEHGDMVVAMAGGGGGSLDDWLRENFKPGHQS